MSKNPTVGECLQRLEDLINETNSLIVSIGYGKRDKKWNTYVFSHKKKIEDKEIVTCLLETIKYIETTRKKENNEYKMK